MSKARRRDDLVRRVRQEIEPAKLPGTRELRLATREATIEAAAPQPFGGFPGRPEWIAEVILWLASEENRFVTGQIIFADGGAEVSAIGDRHWT